MYEIETRLTARKAYFDADQSNRYYAAKYARNGITIHWWGGGEQEDKHDAIVNYFLAQGEAQVKSVNYVVSDAKITLMVPSEYVAWCSGPGNATTISIECEPGLSDEGYKRLAWLIKSLQQKHPQATNIYRHKDWMPTACPGTIDIERIKRDVAGAAPAPLPVVTPPKPTAPNVPNTSAETVYLPSYVETWAAYKPYSSYTKGSKDQVGTLLPKQFGGLTYKIVGKDDNVVFIDTQAFGRVAIWVQGTEAVVRGTATYTAPAAPATKQRVTFPSHAQSWAVYKVGSQYRKNTSDQVGTLLPSRFGGLTYDVVENRGNVVVIDTQNFGRVAAWIKDTDAQLN